MVVKYKGVWNVHLVSDKIDELIHFYKKIEKNSTSATQFAKNCLKKIDEATYWPSIVTFTDKNGEVIHDPEDDKTRNEINYKREHLFDELMISGKIALEDGIISAYDFMDLESLLYNIKDDF